MKVKDLEVFIVGNPAAGMGGRYFIFVKLTTDNGITGIGEVYGATFGPKVMKAMIEDVFERNVAGMDPFHIEELWRRVYGSGYTLRPDATLMGVLSGIEIALWDIKGKALGKPVYELLGGRVHEKLRTYTYIYPGSAAARTSHLLERRKVGRARRPLRQAGLHRHQVRSGRALFRHSIRASRRRRALGSVRKILPAAARGGRHQGRPAVRHPRPVHAVRRHPAGQRLEPYDPLWFEEPMPPEMPEEMALVARATSIPIATGERLVTKYEFARVLECRAASILQMALGRVGGIMEAKKIAAMAETHYAQIAPHLYSGPVEGAANIQFAACLPNFLILESSRPGAASIRSC